MTAALTTLMGQMRWDVPPCLLKQSRHHYSVVWALNPVKIGKSVCCTVMCVMGEKTVLMALTRDRVFTTAHIAVISCVRTWTGFMAILSAF